MVDNLVDQMLQQGEGIIQHIDHSTIPFEFLVISFGPTNAPVLSNR
jgi:hypothetical protein